MLTAEDTSAQMLNQLPSLIDLDACHATTAVIAQPKYVVHSYRFATALGEQQHSTVEFLLTRVQRFVVNH